MLLVSAAHAQSASGPATLGQTNAPARLPEVTVTGQQDSYQPEYVSSPKYTEPLIDVPRSITVVPQSVIQDQAATSLGDVLRNVPGVSMQAGEGGVPAGDNLTIRGFSARTDIFVDGVRDFGGYTRDTFNVEQVEVFQGPASADLGRGSTGGSVNMVSKLPGVTPSYDGTLGFGTANFLRFTADVNLPLETSPIAGTAARVAAMWFQSDVPERDEVHNERWGVAPSVAFGLGTPTQVTLSYFYLGQNNLPDYGQPWVPTNNIPLAAYGDQPAPVDRSNFYGLTGRDYERTDVQIGTVTVNHDFSEDLSLRNLTRYGDAYRNSVITAPRFASTNSTDINRQVQSRDQTDIILANQTDLIGSFTTGRVQHSAVGGVQYDRESSSNYPRSGPGTPLADLYHPNPNVPYQGSVTNLVGGGANKVVANSVGVYAFDHLQLSEQWEFTGGLRWDSFSPDYVDRTGLLRLERTDSKVNWRAGVVFKPRENGSVYFGYGTSFNPSIEGLAGATTAQAVRNLDTPPEESQSFELGTKWSVLRERLFLSLAVFQTDKTNSRTTDPADPNQVVVLDGEQRVRGVEVGVTGTITEKWSVFGGYAFLDSEILTSLNPAEVGNALNNVPRNTFSLWSTYQLPKNFTVGGGSQFVGSRYSSTLNNREAAGYWLFNAMVGYQVTRNINLQVNVFNLANEDYIGSVGGGHYIPGAGRSAVLTASFNF